MLSRNQLPLHALILVSAILAPACKPEEGAATDTDGTDTDGTDTAATDSTATDTGATQPTTGDTDDPPVEFQYCAEQHADGDVIVCDRAFDTMPRVHLPPDDDTTVFAGHPLALRDGRKVTLVDEQGDLAFPGYQAKDPRVPEGFAWPSYEFIEHVYRISGTITTRADGVAIADAEVTPVLRLAPEVLDGQLLGTWEGTLSKRIDDGHYDETVRVPIRVTFDRFSDEHHDLHRWNPYDDADPILTYSLPVLGTIVNASQPITLSDGTCAPALTSLGEGNPWFGLGDEAELLRELAMHTLGDTQLLFMGWMGPMDPATPAALIQDEVRDVYTRFSAYPHGTPNGQHLDDFVRVSAGGEACTP
ncbi:hypothetical protein [Nannocystis sp. SCPEA4]|uniref:hypothetical protein n=1 Tax=Nannocystis sp. SCPEA4 TaxID=2996787 RepID=UPI00227065F6|nr:hypothetical protein [Nannocystis sp. SCPEA4]MCY1059191.1 hypothetical protein [Nannocystis sp. SCPEA4]